MDNKDKEESQNIGRVARKETRRKGGIQVPPGCPAWKPCLSFRKATKKTEARTYIQGHVYRVPELKDTSL